MAFRDRLQFRLTLFYHRLRGAHFTLPLFQQRSCRRHRAFGFFDLRDSFQPLLLQHAGIHFRQHLTLTDELPFRHEDRVNSPGNLGGNIHFSGFNSAVAGCKPLRYSRRTKHPPCYRGHHDQDARHPPHHMTFKLIHIRPAVIPVIKRCVSQSPLNSYSAGDSIRDEKE